MQAGWHATFIDGSLFVEPSAEVVAGHTTGYMLRGDQSSFNIRVNTSNPVYAKIGTSAGVNFQADDQHGLMLAAGIFRLQNLRRSGGVDMLNNSVQGDMLRNPMADDSRYLVNISVNARLSSNWRIYSQFESSFAAKNLKNDYSGQFGVRYQF